MDRDAVETMSRVARILASARSRLSTVEPRANCEVRELLGDCQEIMAQYCDCSPIMLIAGRVDDIMENFNALHKRC